MTLNGVVRAGALIAALAVSTAAPATQYIFTVDGPYAISFAIAKETPPDMFTPSSAFFRNVRITVGGIAGLAGITLGDTAAASMMFADTAHGHIQVSTEDQFFFLASGRPHYNEGRYAVAGELGGALLTIREIDGVPEPGVIIPLVVTAPVDPKDPVVTISPVPEPATWLLLITGLGLVGFMRRSARPIYN